LKEKGFEQHKKVKRKLKESGKMFFPFSFLLKS